MKTKFNEFINEDFDDDIDFEDDDEYVDFFDNHQKIYAELCKNFGKSHGNDANWGGSVWSILTKNNYEGIFIFLGDDDLVLLKREFDEENEENIDTDLFTVTDEESFRKLIEIAKDKEKVKMLLKINKYNV